MRIILFLPSAFANEHFLHVFFSFCSSLVWFELLPSLLHFSLTYLMVKFLIKLIETTSKKDQKLSLNLIQFALKRVILDFDFSEFVVEFVAEKIVEIIFAGASLFELWNLPAVLPL